MFQDCGDIKTPDGDTSNVIKHIADQTFGANGTLQCPEGYRVSGGNNNENTSMPTQCLANATWSRIKLICEKKGTYDLKYNVLSHFH